VCLNACVYVRISHESKLLKGDFDELEIFKQHSIITILYKDLSNLKKLRHYNLEFFLQA